MQISPKYTCSIGNAHPERGIGLRFPRFLGLRQDKDPEDATPSSMIYDLYKQQAAVMNTNAIDEQEDYY